MAGGEGGMNAMFGEDTPGGDGHGENGGLGVFGQLQSLDLIDIAMRKGPTFI